MNDQEQTAIVEALSSPAGQTGGAIEFKPGDSFFHRLHPATKIVFAISIVAVVFLLSDFRGPLVILCLLLAVLFWFDFLRPVAKTAFLLSIPFGVSLLLVHGLFNPANQTPLITVGSVPFVGALIIWKEGIQFGLLFYFRLTSVIIAVLSLIRTTHPRKLSIGLENKGVPRKLTYVFMSTLQLASQVKMQARSIADAQQARALDTNANILERLKSLVAMIVPLFISILITTQTRALALESRGFSRKGGRTALLEIVDTRLDKSLRWMMVGFVAVVFITQVVL